MRVGLVCESEVTDIFGTVDGLPQRTQHDGLQQLRVGAVLTALKQLRVIACMRRCAAAELQPEALQKLAQSKQSFGRGSPMDPIERRVVMSVQKTGGADVRRKHAFLDQAVRVVALHRNDALDLAMRVENHLGFDAVEYDVAAFDSRFVECLVQDLQIHEYR